MKKMKKLLQIKSKVDKISYSIHDARKELDYILNQWTTKDLVKYIMESLSDEEVVDWVNSASYRKRI